MADKPVLINFDFSSGAKIKGLGQATANGEPVVKEQLDALIEGLAWKDDVVAASTANVNLSAPGATLDGVTLTGGDRILLKNQTAGAENGVYIWNGASTTATRAPDMSVSAEFNSAVVPVTGGTNNAGTRWRVTVANPNVGTTAITFTNDQSTAPAASESAQGIAEIATQSETDTGTDDGRIVTPKKLKDWAGGPKRYATDVGDGSATSFTVTHNLGTRDVNVRVRRNSGNYEDVIVDIQAATINTVIVVFGAAPTSNAFRVIVTA